MGNTIGEDSKARRCTEVCGKESAMVLKGPEHYRALCQVKNLDISHGH